MKARYGAAVISVAICLTVAGCGSDSQPAASSSTEFSEVVPAEPTTSQEQPKAELSGDFPSEVPVIAGKYLQSPGVTENSHLLTVTGVQEGDYASAKKKLVEAGFTKRVEEKRKALFVGKGLVVTLALVNNEKLGGLALTYTVNPG